MKEKIKEYVTGIWGVEILTLVILLVTLGTGYYNAFNDSAAKIGAGTFDALFNKNKYIESMIYYESRAISEYIYNNSNNLEDISAIEYENQYLKENYYYEDEIFYVLINKETGDFTTDDPKLANVLSPYYTNVVLLEDNINSYLKEIGLSSVRLDNKDKYNYYVMSSEDKASMKNIDKYIEIYYKNPDA